VPDLAKTSISVIVNPAIGLLMMQKLFAGQPSTYPAAVWMQPGAESKSIEDFVKEKNIQDRVVMGGRCILVSGDGVREELRAEKGKL
jgi:predicted CoA-binding protein